MTAALFTRSIVLGLHFRPNLFFSKSKLLPGLGGGGGGRGGQQQLLQCYRNESNHAKRHVSQRSKRIAASASLESPNGEAAGSKKSEESSDSQSLAPSQAADVSLGPVPGDFVERIPLEISKEDVEVQFSRSGGAGGQNVNKVNTKAEVRLKLESTLSWMPSNVRSALMTSQANRITNSGELVVTSSRHRRQKQNLDDALSKMQSFIDDAVLAVAPKEANPEKEKKMKASLEKAKEKRLESKKKKTEKKKLRGKVKSWD